MKTVGKMVLVCMVLLLLLPCISGKVQASQQNTVSSSGNADISDGSEFPQEGDIVDIEEEQIPIQSGGSLISNESKENLTGDSLLEEAPRTGDALSIYMVFGGLSLTLLVLLCNIRKAEK